MGMPSSERMPASSPAVSLPSRYRVTRRIASGGMATVYAAEDTTLGRLVAVKVLASHFAADDGARERFQREARAAARVSDHAHVVTIYDIGEHDGMPFIVMEYFPGGTLADRLRSGEPIPRPTALTWLEDAASALDHAHKHGIVHRDVKPGNLLLDDHGRCGVADFGIARMANEAAGQLTQTGQVLGTAAYLSPEQALGEPATAASDRYALAVVAYELLTGRRPFEAEHVAAQARAHVEAEPPAASDTAGDLPAAVDRVLWRGLEKDAGKRWRSAAAMVSALDDALGDAAEPDRTAATRAAVAAAAPPPPRTPRPRTPVPRNRPVPPRTPPRSARVASGAPEPRRRGRAWIPVAILAALALLVGGGIALMSGGGGGGDDPAQRASGTGAQAEQPASSDKPKKRTKAKAQTGPTAAEQQAAEDAAAAEAAAEEQAAEDAAAAEEQPVAEEEAPAPEPTGDPVALQASGHQALLAGDLDTAITDLQQAIQDCPVSTTDPCAYAYYDLGVALTQAGRPAEAIPILETRATNPNQPGAVQAALDEARAAAGQ
ncbi:MAG TPA: serine/threonine-protein kinase [Capillimicrobium sp.]